jgi:toxin YhaV
MRSSPARISIPAWVNHRDTLRKAGAARHPDAMFSRTLGCGNPPDDWSGLLAVAQSLQGSRWIDAAADAATADTG